MGQYFGVNFNWFVIYFQMYTKDLLHIQILKYEKVLIKCTKMTKFSQNFEQIKFLKNCIWHQHKQITGKLLSLAFDQKL